MPVVASQIPMALFDAGPVERIAAFGGTSPSALRQIFVAKQAGPFKSTALVVAQSGPWIVKIRATSATLDRAGLAGRIDRHLAAIRMPSPAFAAALDAPAVCKAALKFAAGKPVTGDVASAAASGIVIQAFLHGPAPTLCLADAPNARFTLLGQSDRPTSWVLLMGDAGKAIGSDAIDAGSKDTRQLVYVATTAATRGAAVFDAPPSLETAAGVAAPLLRDPKAGLFTVGTSDGPAPP